MQGQREHTLGHRSGPTAWRDDYRDASCCGRHEIDVIDTDPSACENAQPWGALEKRCIDDDVGPHDRADGLGDVLWGGIGDESDVLAKDPSDQRWIHGAECHHHRTLDRHSPHPLAVTAAAGSPPNVARGTTGTCCHVPLSLEAVAAAMTSAT